MGFFDKVGSFLKREAKDIGDAAENAKGKFDDELTKREAELKMTPSEKIAALQRDAESTDARFGAIMDKATGQGALADARAEVAGLPTDPDLPSVTHIVLPDGRVKFGDDDQAAADAVIDEQGKVHDVPSVVAPSVDDLEKFEEPPKASITEPADPVPVDVAAADEAAIESETSAEVAADTNLPQAPAPESMAPPSVPDAPSVDIASNAGPAESDALSAATETGDADTPVDSSDQDAEPIPTAPSPSSPDYGKTPAQLKYERAREAANDLLDELRGELKDDGTI